jgi:F420-non-reducing hydrogenase iron-sulfur subunit
MSMKGVIVAFCCQHSGYPAADLAGRLGLVSPEALRIIRVPCAGRVDVIHMLRAFENGAAAVAVLGCEEGACHHITGSTRAKERAEQCSMLLKEIGIDGGRVAMFHLSPNAPRKFVDVTNEIEMAARALREAR